MKRIVLIMLMALMVLNGGIILGILTESNGEMVSNTDAVGSIRAMACEVVDKQDARITVEDELHNRWSFIDQEIEVDEMLCVWFYNMNTEQDLTDDVIIDYCKVVTDQ